MKTDTILGVVFRIIALPFIFIIITLYYFIFVARMLYNYIKYGGETIIYNKNTNRKTILEVFDKVSELTKTD